MRAGRATFTAVAMLLVSGASAWGAEESVIQGELLDPALYGDSYIESMADAIHRDRYMRPPINNKDRQGRSGVWAVPTRGASSKAASGERYAVNKWGDTRMGIGFGRLVDVHGAYFLGQAGRGVWTTGVQVRGFREGAEVAGTTWFRKIGTKPAWFAIELRGVDRIEIHAEPAAAGCGWYGLDDLTYSVVTGDADQQSPPVVVRFDDLDYRATLTGSGYAGLTWETGTGDFAGGGGVHGPMQPLRSRAGDGDAARASGRGGSLPTLLASYQGVIRGDADSMSYPPDTDGAIGPNHYVETVNRNFAVYDKTTGAELTNILLGSFLPESNGDPRVLFDQHSGRWFVIVSDFSATASTFLAVSLTDDPMGDWFKTSFVNAQGSDEFCWPDYPTLGVDAVGIYTADYMVGCGMSIFAIDKTPLIAPSPSLGGVLAFRGLSFEGAIQPAHTYGSANGEYLISLDSSTSLRLRRVNTGTLPWTLVDHGAVSVPSYSEPPNAPALGSTTPLNTVDDRLMMSVYRDGSLWTAHTIEVDGRAGCRWYEIDVETASVVQTGTVAHPSLYFFFPSIMVNQYGNVVMGFSGSNSSQYAACYYTGRLASDPPGEMAPPVMYKEGTGPQNNIDSFGRNRWGDYSYTTLDPVDELTFWTIQEYGHDTDIWGTYMAVLSHGDGDCNENEIPDPCDIDCGPAGGECDLPGCGESIDCNGNNIPDECELDTRDCNTNGVPDDCDLEAGTSADCNDNQTPDECEEDCNGNGVPDDCDLAAGTSLDCNFTGLPDECDIASGSSIDCQPNGVPDECEVGPTEVTIAFNLDSDPGWTTQGQWAWGQPTGGGGTHGGPDPTSGYTGPNVYGYNLDGDYAASLPETHLTSDAIDCSGLFGVQLSFWRWLGVETSDYDHASVSVSNNGTSWTTVWENTGEVADSAWTHQEFDISAIADNQSTLYLRWTMGQTDSIWQFCGWNIDDITVSGETLGGGEGDCNANLVPDECDIAAGTSLDCNHTAIPDECEPAISGFDHDGDGDIDLEDFVGLSECLAGPSAVPDPPSAGCVNACRDAFDADGDDDVDLDDFDAFQRAFGG